MAHGRPGNARADRGGRPLIDVRILEACQILQEAWGRSQSSRCELPKSLRLADPGEDLPGIPWRTIAPGYPQNQGFSKIPGKVRAEGWPCCEISKAAIGQHPGNLPAGRDPVA